jgi:hypothetical protein
MGRILPARADNMSAARTAMYAYRRFRFVVLFLSDAAVSRNMLPPPLPTEAPRLISDPVPELSGRGVVTSFDWTGIVNDVWLAAGEGVYGASICAALAADVKEELCVSGTGSMFASELETGSVFEDSWASAGTNRALMCAKFAADALICMYSDQ